MTRDSTPLSVVVGTTRPWPEVKDCLEGFLEEARAVRAEVIVLDRDGDGLPDDAEDRYRGIRRFSEPRASIYRMRSLGMSMARGDVVLTTEDHCRPRPGWCAAHLRAHSIHPQAVAVGGPVDNGARRRLADWASFLLGHVHFLPPGESGECAALDRSNVSYKRSSLPAAPSPYGKDDPPVDQELRRDGKRFVFTREAVVDHCQSIGLLGTLGIHYHNGRAVAGLRRLRGMSRRERAARTLASLPAGGLFFLRTSVHVLRNRALPRRAVASLPVLAVITTLVGTGLLVGHLAGPGSSPQELR
jgi:hypothetical protein